MSAPDTPVQAITPGKRRHDLRNHLHASQGFLDLLLLERNGILNDKQKHCVSRAGEAISRCLDLIDSDELDDHS